MKFNINIRIGMLIYCLLLSINTFAQNSKYSIDVVDKFYNGWKSLSTLKDHSTGNAYNIECAINECAEGGSDCEDRSRVSLPREMDHLLENSQKSRAPIALGSYINDFEEFISSTRASFTYSYPKFLGSVNFKEKKVYDVYTVNKVYQWNGSGKELKDTVWVSIKKGYKISGVRNVYGGSGEVSSIGLNGNTAPSSSDLGIQIASMYSSGNQEGALDLYKKYVQSDYTIGVNLNYDQNFPLGLSVIGSYKMLMLGADFGLNLDSKKYLVEKMELSDILNYKYESNNYDPKCFLTLSPALYLKYISIGCGLGFVYFGGDHIESQWESSSTLSGFTSSHTGSSDNTAQLFKFIARPQIRGYIPITRSSKLSIGGGYDIIPGFKELNGFSVSLGFHWDIDDWDVLF